MKKKRRNYATYKREQKRKKILSILSVTLAFALVIVVGAVIISKRGINFSSSDSSDAASGSAIEASADTGNPLDKKENRDAIVAQANALATQYDYDGAIQFIQEQENFANYQEFNEAVAEYEASKADLVEVDITQVPHFFTHPLIYDAKLAFSTDMKDGYQQESLTVNEFNSFLQQMYDNNYVLVDIHDVAPSYKDKKGNKRVKPGKILLPKGKKAFLFSEDDTNYYERWQKKGVGSRLVVGEDGKPTVEVDLPDGSKIRGDYDVIPCIDRFLEKHPDFSYKGAKAMIGVTGIEGVFGYRTSKYVLGEYNRDDISSEKDFDKNSEDARMVTQVAQAIRDDGFTLSSHSFVHGAFYSNGQYCSQKYLKYDISRFKNEIRSLIGNVDTILYPNGADIEHGEDNWEYKLSNPRFNKLYKSGLLYYFNVDTNPESPWGRIGKNYYRGRRVGLIGYTVLCKKDFMKKYFGISNKKMVDKDRPLPKELDYYGVKVKVNCK